MVSRKIHTLFLSLLATCSVNGSIEYGSETYPEAADALKAMTFSGPVASPALVPSESGVTLKLSGTGGTGGVVKRLGSFQREGELVHITTRISNPTPSFVSVELQLYNTTEKSILTKSSPIVIRNNENPAVNVSLEYKATRQDVGDALVLCWVQTSTEHPGRSFCIEQTDVTSIRPMDVMETFSSGDPSRLKPAVFSGEAGLPTLQSITKDADNGDGLGDGSVAVSSTELGGTYGAVWKLGKVEQSNVMLSIETVWFAAGNSYVKVDVQLYNATTDSVLASSGEFLAKNIDAPPVTASLNYTLLSSDKDCELEVRWVQTSTEHPSRNFVIDRLSVKELSK